MLTLNQASRIVDAALTLGRDRRLQPLCIVVVDAGGHPLALKRDERASIGRPEIAMAKAAGCLALGFGGREVARRAEAMPGFVSALSNILPNGIVPVPGGVLVRNSDGTLLGAVGVSGDTSDNDEYCAVAGIEEAGLVADTGA